MGKNAQNKRPKTIEELKQWYADRGLPPYDETRFFIGIDYKEPKAFGIYKQGNNFVVYKNKNTGERAIRYNGPDEAFAVNELWLKLKEEIRNQKSLQYGRPNLSHEEQAKYAARTQIWKEERKFKDNLAGAGTLGGFGMIFLLVISMYSYTLKKLAFAAFISALIALVFVGIYWLVKYKILKRTDYFIKDKKRRKTSLLIAGICIYLVCFGIARNYYMIRYYKYEDKYYCQYQNDFYEYYYDEDEAYWYYDFINDADLPVDFYSDYSNYQVDYNVFSSGISGCVPFENSTYYDDTFNDTSAFTSDYDNDGYDYDWDSGSSWDSGGTDWGSDW